MGQQQLLLVILVTIIVGIATVVAINTFSSSADSANVDAVRQDLLSIGASAQGYYMKPTMLGGGGNSFTGLTFNEISVPGTVDDPTTGLILTNDNGTYTLTPVDANSFTVKGNPKSGGAITATVTKDNVDMGTYNPAGS